MFNIMLFLSGISENESDLPVVFGRGINDLSGAQSDVINSSLKMLGGPSGFTYGKIIAYVIFGAVGFVAFTYGKKQKNYKVLLAGVALMGYPYFVTSTFWLYAVGAGLCLLLYYWRD